MTDAAVSVSEDIVRALARQVCWMDRGDWIEGTVGNVRCVISDDPNWFWIAAGDKTIGREKTMAAAREAAVRHVLATASAHEKLDLLASL